LAGRDPETEKKKQAGRQAHQVQAGSDASFFLFKFSPFIFYFLLMRWQGKLMPTNFYPQTKIPLQ
jgi:hypothetical protein